MVVAFSVKWPVIYEMICSRLFEEVKKIPQYSLIALQRGDFRLAGTMVAHLTLHTGVAFQVRHL